MLKCDINQTVKAPSQVNITLQIKTVVEHKSFQSVRTYPDQANWKAKANKLKE